MSRSFLGAVLCTLLLCAIIPPSVIYYNSHLCPPRKLSLDQHRIPPDPRVVGLVFYGRRSRVAILDCYLKVPPLPFFLFL